MINLGDPWREATMGAQLFEHVPSTPTQPIAVSDGFHCSDLKMSNGAVDKTVAAVQAQALASMKTWMEEWQARSKTGRRV